jgi:hypothetical protein
MPDICPEPALDIAPGGILSALPLRKHRASETMKTTNVFMLLGDSAFAGDEGGDAWIHEFLGGIYSRRGDFRFEIVALPSTSEPDRATALESLVRDGGNVTVRPSRHAFRLWANLRAVRARLARLEDEPDIVIGVGTLNELLLILLAPKLRKARRVICLRNCRRQGSVREARQGLARLHQIVRLELYRTADALICDDENTASQLLRQGIDATVLSDASAEQMDRFDLILSGLLGAEDCPNCEQLRTKNEILKAMLQDEIHANLVDEIGMVQGLIEPKKPKLQK